MTENDGYLTLSRRFFQTAIWTAARTFNESEAWLDLIQSARFEPSEHIARVGGREVIERRGELVASQRFLSKRWQWSEKKVRGFMSKLRKNKMVETETRSGVTIVRLVNYDKYNFTPQDAPKDAAKGALNDLFDNELDTQRAQQGAQQRAQPANKGREKGANLNKGNNLNLSPSLCSGDLSPGETPCDAEPPDKKQKDEIDFKAFLQFFNKTVKGSHIPEIRILTDRRKEMLNARLKEYDKQALVEVVQKAADSNFLNGGGDKPFVATFDWIFRPNNFPKVLEGNYDNRTSSNYGQHEQPRRTIYQTQQLANISAAEQDVMESIRKTIGGAEGIPKELPVNW